MNTWLNGCSRLLSIGFLLVALLISTIAQTTKSYRASTLLCVLQGIFTSTCVQTATNKSVTEVMILYTKGRHYK